MEPVNREKHFLVSEVEYDDDGVVISCKLEAVLSKNEYSVDWKELRLQDKWLQGWK
ncbi:TIGR02450 family Trp-rich protein [Vibrio sp. PNB22_3_1]